MGLFNKIKAAGRALTGGAAEVHVDLPDDISLGAPFTVTVRANIDDQALKIDGVYLLVRAVEQLEIDREQFEVRSDRMEVLDDDWGNEVPDSSEGPNNYRGEEETCDLRIAVAGAAELEANQTYTWETEVRLPAGSLPTYIGRSARHVWMIQAGLDAFGNDPDSGWIEFQVRA